MAAVIDQEITNAGGTFTYDPQLLADGTTVIIYSNSALTLTGDIDIVISNLPNLGNRFFINSAIGVNDIDLNGHTFKINGQSYPQWVVNNQFTYEIQTAKAGVATQQVYFDLFLGGNDIGLDGDATINDGSISLSKFAALTSGCIIVGNGSNIPTAVAMSGDVTIDNAGATTISAKAVTLDKMADLESGKIILGSAGNLPTAVTPTGDVTISNTGVMTIGNGKVKPSMLDPSISTISEATLSLTSAQILALNGTPQQIIATPGIGKSITVISAMAQLTFGSAAYTTNVEVDLYIDTAPDPVAKITNCLDAASSMIFQFGKTEGSSANGTQIVQNKGLFVTVPSGNPAVGDGTLLITVTYLIQ